VKVGMSTRLPNLRLAEINSDKPYAGLGPWVIHDFIEVEDAQAVETIAHRALRLKHVRDVLNANELFDVSAQSAFDVVEKAGSGSLVGKVN
jgi:uncharacterized protein YunC (DUF1805 family)